MDDDAVIQTFDAFEFLVMTNYDAAVPEVIRQGVGHLLIEKCQQTIAGIDQIDLHVQPRKIDAYSQPITPAP